MRLNVWPRAGSSGQRLLSWTRPTSYWDVVVAHLPLALVTGAALLLPRLVSLDHLPLLDCAFLGLTGYPCPFCGFTRSFWAMAAGHWRPALANCPLSCLVYGAAVIFFLWHSTALLAGVRLTSGLYRLLRSIHAGRLLAAMVLLNWIYRLAMGLK